MATTTTPNMNMQLPNPADVANPQAGPTWAHNVNDAFEIVDSHDHYTAGVPVPAAGLKMNADLPFTFSGSYYGPTLMAYAGFNPQTAPTPGTHTSSLYVNAAGALFYRGNTGVDVLISGPTALANTGTGLYNGFYGDYAAAGPAARAVAVWTAGSSSYEFYGDLGGSTSPSTFFELSDVTAKTVKTNNPGVGSRAFMNFDPGVSTFGGTAKGGWALINPNAAGTGFAFGLDSVTGSSAGADGSYANAVLGVYNATPYAAPGKWGFSINRPDAAGTFLGRAANPLDIWYYGTASNSPESLGSLTALTNNGGLTAGYGARLSFAAGGTSWAGYGNALPTVRTQGSIDSFFQSATTANGAGLRFHGAYGGTLSTTAGIEVVSLSAGVDSIGLGGAATSALVTIYGNMVPNTDNTRNLGTATERWAILYTGAIVSSGGLTINANTSITGQLNTSGAVISAGYVQGTAMLPTATGALGPGAGGIWKNTQTLAWARITTAGAVTSGYNMGAAAIGVPSADARSYTIPFLVPVDASASYTVQVTSLSTDTSPNSTACSVGAISGTQIVVYQKTAGIANGILVHVVGLP